MHGVPHSYFNPKSRGDVYDYDDGSDCSKIRGDQELFENKSVFAHKLCGAGNGGFFLTFSKKEKLDIPFDCVKIDVETTGVTGKEL